MPNIAARGHGETWITAITAAFDDLEDKFDRYFANLDRQTKIPAFRRRPSWERPGAERLDKPRGEPRDSERWMEEWDRERPR